MIITLSIFSCGGDLDLIDNHFQLLLYLIDNDCQLKY
ncbi:hypothetical protein ACUXIR_001564 [Staphylococcus hominis]